MFVLPQQLELFQGIDDPDLSAQIDDLKILRFPKGFLLFDQGDQDCDVMAILHGEVEIVGRGTDGEFQRVTVLKEGDLFGELSYFTRQPRSFAAVTLGDCAILSIRAQWLQKMGEKYPALNQRLQALFRSRVLGNILRSSKLFSRIAPKRLNEFATKMTLQIVQEGDAIIREGESDLSLYVIKKGKVVVSKMKQGRPLILQELGPGELFGEMAVVSGQVRSASVYAAGRVELMAMKGEEFKAFIKYHPLLLHGIEDMVRNRSVQMRQSMETVVSEVLAEEWDDEALSAGLRVADLNVAVEVKGEGSQMSGTLDETSAQRCVLTLKETVAPERTGENVVFCFVEGQQKVCQELRKVPPITASVGSVQGGKMELLVTQDPTTKKGILSVLGILARAKLKGLIFPRYEAKGSGIVVRVRGKRGAEMRGDLLSLSLTNARLLLEGPVPMGETATVRFEQKGNELTTVQAIPLEADGDQVEVQFECNSSEEKSALEKVIRLLSGKVGLASVATESQKQTEAINRPTVMVSRPFKTAAEFIRIYMTSIESGVLKVASPKALTAGTPIQIQLLIPGFPEVRKANCVGVVKSWAKGKSIVEFTDEQPELKERLAVLFQKLMALETEKSWQSRQENMLVGRSNYSIWDDPKMRVTIVGTLTAANVVLYFAIYFYLS